ncbi:MAG: hypothetical protein HKN23_07820 [Verrucomicrobiales bacterium]|nr:hypothetical protein [Verrucomicrobiales bacterium]
MSRRITRNTILLALAAAVFAALVDPGIRLLWLAGILILALGALSLAARTEKGKRRLELVPTAAVAIPLFLAVVILVVQGTPGRFARSEGWETHVQQSAHRVYWNSRPAIAPSVIAGSHPQRFYVQTAGFEGELTVEIIGVRHPATGLGEGLFYFDFNPAKTGFPMVESDGEVPVTLEYGSGKPRTVSLRVAPARPAPRWIDSDPEQGVAVSASFPTDQVFVLWRDGTVQFFPTADGPVDARVDPVDTATAWILHGNVPELQQVDLNSGKVKETMEIVPGAKRIAISPEGERAAIAFEHVESGVQIVDLEAGTAQPPIALEFTPDWLVFGESDLDLVVSGLRDQTLRRLRISKTGDSVEESQEALWLGRPARFLLRDQWGGSVFLTSSGYSSPPTELKNGNHLIQHRIVQIDLEKWTVDSVIETSRSTGKQLASVGRDSGLDPMGLAQGPGVANTILAVFSGSGDVGEFATDRPTPPKFQSLADVGLFNPHGVASLGQGMQVVADPVFGGFAIRVPREKRWQPVRLGRAVDPGEVFFYQATRGGFSCQSCHLHGDSDFAHHNLGAISGTTGLTAGIDRTAPFFRFGYPGKHYNRIADVHSALALDQLLGYPRGQPENVSGLVEDWMLRQPRPKNPRWETADPEQLRRGYGLFQKGGCAVCHPPPLFTNHSQHLESWLFNPKVGARQPDPLLDVPSLLQTWRQPEYFHHREFDLDTVLEVSVPPNRHGDVSGFSEEELADLKEFLLSL